MNTEIETKIEKLEEQNGEFRDAIGCIRTDLAVIKEKYDSMNDKIVMIDQNFLKLIQTVSDLRRENNDQHKSMVKTLMTGVITITASVIAAMAAIVSAFV